MDLFMSDLDLIKKGEGLRLNTYKDTMGKNTVGWGFNLDKPGAANIVKAAGGDISKIKPIGSSITPTMADKLLNYELGSARNIVNQQYGNTIKNPAAKAVVTDMAYNLGGAGLADFKNFKSAIQAGNYNKAADEIKNSAYYHQTGSRAQRNIDQLRAIKLDMLI